jgi:hypothetical protein
MRKGNLLLATCIAMTWSGLTVAQTTTGGAQGAQGDSSASSASSAQGSQSAAPRTTAGTPTAPGVQAPVRQPSTSPPPSAPPPRAQTSPTPSAATPASNDATPASNEMPQQTVMPNEPNSANRAQNTPNDANRARAATQTYAVPPASRRVGTTGNRPDCSQLRGIEKSECERRDTSRDDLPAGVTSTQPPQPPR